MRVLKDVETLIVKRSDFCCHDPYEFSVYCFEEDDGWENILESDDLENPDNDFTILIKKTYEKEKEKI